MFSPDMMAQASRMMSEMSPAQRAAMFDQVSKMDPNEMKRMMAQAQAMV